MQGIGFDLSRSMMTRVTSTRNTWALTAPFLNAGLIGCVLRKNRVGVENRRKQVRGEHDHFMHSDITSSSNNRIHEGAIRRGSNYTRTPALFRFFYNLALLGIFLIACRMPRSPYPMSDQLHSL